VPQGENDIEGEKKKKGGFVLSEALPLKKKVQMEDKELFFERGL